ncbi:MAG: NADH-quinone oxidoreductase subunit M [Planctomycetes bacterium]|nr:NADH-quinone oxidoreductase subunit M [Planctomycetota bacterium]
MFDFNSSFLLSLFTFIPVLGMLFILLLPNKDSRNSDIVKSIAAAASFASLCVSVIIVWTFYKAGSPAGIYFEESYNWIPKFGIKYHLGVDGFSVPLVLLSGLVSFVSVIASWGIDKQVKGYFALMLLLITGMNGVFVSLDFFLFFVFWEVMLLPMYFLIGIWGGPKRVYAAIKFFLYTMAGSVLMLVALLIMFFASDDAPVQVDRIEEGTVYSAHGKAIFRQGSYVTDENTGVAKFFALADLDESERENLGVTDQGAQFIRAHATFDLVQYRAIAKSYQSGLYPILGWTPTLGQLLFILLFIGFAIKVPLFPFHTWLPWAHVEAPTAISVILAGLLLKMGTYAFLRVSYPIFPEAAISMAIPIAIIAVINIIYGAMCAMAQSDMKKLVAYSSVSHMGFCLLGLAACTHMGVLGGALQQFNHGTSTAMMFLLVGVIYDRAHHRQIGGFGGIAKVMPTYTTIMTIALFASMGLPGLSGFVSEVLVFLGSFSSGAHLSTAPQFMAGAVTFQTLTVISVLGVILTAAYLLWMMQRIFFGPLNQNYLGLTDLTPRETFTLVPLALVIIFLGVYPSPIIEVMDSTVTEFTGFFHGLIPEGALTTVAQAAP